MLQLSTIVYFASMTATVLAAAVSQERDAFTEPGGIFHCGAFDDSGACQQYIAQGASPVTFEALNKTVIVPDGTQFTPETGVSFDAVSAVPGAIVQRGLPAPRVQRRDGQCKNGGPLQPGDETYKNCRAEDAIPARDHWHMGGHNCKTNKRSGKYYLCCLEEKPCPEWRVGRFGGCLNNLKCTCSRVKNWVGYHGGECFK